MQKKIMYAATAVMLLGTTGCIDKIVQKTKSIFCACPAQADAEPAKEVVAGDADEAKGEQKYPVISAEVVKNDLETNDTMLLINVLAKKYYDDCHIVGSVNMPVDSIAKDIEGIDKDAKVVLYCANSTCMASKNAADRLAAIGYTNLHLYEGGMKEWIELGYSAEGPAEESYLHKGK